MPAIIFCITIALIVGYSWRDTHFASPSVVGYGFSVAYRRFLAVSAGITIGVIGSLLPTPLSGRTMIRTTCSRTVTELGQLHTDLQEYAYRRLHSVPGCRGKPEESIGLRQIAIQVKLNATKAQIAVQRFEPPLQGNWPGVLYSDLVALQVELIDLYGSFHSLLQQLEPIWVESLLERNGWSDVHFVADQFAVIYMCANATKTGNALPQVTPSPLVDRFYTRMAGLKIAKVNRHGIPRDVDTETLHDWQYALYAIGCTLSFAICYVHSPLSIFRLFYRELTCN
jgi:Aromatic acid exporter family member 2